MTVNPVNHGPTEDLPIHIISVGAENGQAAGDASGQAAGLGNINPYLQASPRIKPVPLVDPSQDRTLSPRRPTTATPSSTRSC